MENILVGESYSISYSQFFDILEKLPFDIKVKAESYLTQELNKNQLPDSLIPPTAKGSPTMLFGAWADTDYDPQNL